MQISLSIVLPCYNESQSLEALFEEYASVASQLPGTELVVVDNGSTDSTPTILAELVERSWPFQLTIVNVMPNKGYGNGIMAGVRSARGEFITWTHADSQCPPHDTLRLYQAMLQQDDPVSCFGKGHRTNDRGKASIFTTIQAHCADIILGYKMEEINAQPKMFHRSFVKQLNRAPSGYELDTFAYYHALKNNKKIVPIEVLFLERKHGASKWSYSKISRIRFIFRNFIYLLRLRVIGY